MKRYLIILALALIPVCGFAGVDGHRFGVGIKSSIPVEEGEIMSLKAEGVYEMNFNKFFMGGGLGLGAEVHGGHQVAVVTPVFLRVGYEITDKFMISANGGYKVNLSYRYRDAQNPSYSGFFVEPHFTYQAKSGLRLSLGAELYDGLYNDVTRVDIPNGAGINVKEVRHIRAAISIGIGFVFGK